ncbi:hybrid signal transduction histidine kinase M [Tanacetum coccineum]
MEAYFQKIESLMTILAILNSPVSDEDVVHYALAGLPNKYDQVCGYMHYKDVFPDLKTARTLLITEEMHLKTKANALLADSSSPMVFLAESGNYHRSSPMPHVKPWKPCFNFAKGTCQFGDRCQFVHDPNAKNTPNNSVELNSSNMDELVVNLLGRLGMNAKLDPSTVSPSNDKGTLTQPSPAVYYVSPNPGPTYFQPAQYHSPSTPPGFGLPFTLSMPNVSPPGVTNTLSAHQVSFGPATVLTGIMGSATVPGQATALPTAFTVRTLHDPAIGA